MSIKAVLIRFEGENAILKSEDGANFSWPKSKLPAKAVVNSVLRIAISPDNDAESSDAELAKDILNEILNTGQDEKI